MDAFESIIAALLHVEGYWTATTYKVELTKEDKEQIGRKSSPRWEIDVVAYSPASNELLAVECKSLLNSRGVLAAAVLGENQSPRYKLFREKTLRNVVLGRLTKQMVDRGLCRADPTVRLCLATGKIVSAEARQRLHSVFDANGWLLFDEFWIRERLQAAAKSRYENAIAPVVAKLLLRNIAGGNTWS